MTWRDWLLGRDSDDLMIVRSLRTVIWWAAWLNLITAVIVFLFFLHSMQPASPHDPKTAISP
jgi:hypothetical protein